MTGREYMRTQLAIVEVGKRIADLDLDAFTRSISNAETMAPMLDPTLYQRAQANLTALKELAEVLKPVQAKFRAVQEAVLNTSMAYLARGEKQPSLPSTEDETPPKGLPV